MNVLFVCSMNQWRSPTAEKLYGSDPRINVRSRGTSQKARRTISQADLLWADVLFVMEDRHRQIIEQQFTKQLAGKHIVVLDIPDDYRFMDEELVDFLRESVEHYLETS